MKVALDLTLYLLLRHAPGVRPEVIQLFAFVNVGLMLVDLGLTRLAISWRGRSERALLTVCILTEALAGSVWIQMTGSVSSYFLIIGFLLIALYRLLADYAAGLTCALAITFFHCATYALETMGVLRPASLFVSAPLGIYETPLFRASAIVTLLVGYALTFLAMNFFASTLREKEVALLSARRDLARAVDETRSLGRLCGLVIAERYELHELLGRGGMGEVYRGRRMDDGCAVAVKVLHPYLNDRKGMRERFHRGCFAARISRSARRQGARVRRHRRRPRVHRDGAPVRRGLGDAPKRRASFAMSESVPLGGQDRGGASTARAAGVVHRDLKPENVFLLEGSDEVRLLDFGIARFKRATGSR